MTRRVPPDRARRPLSSDEVLERLQAASGHGGRGGAPRLRLRPRPGRARGGARHRPPRGRIARRRPPGPAGLPRGRAGPGRARRPVGPRLLPPRARRCRRGRRGRGAAGPLRARARRGLRSLPPPRHPPPAHGGGRLLARLLRRPGRAPPAGARLPRGRGGRRARWPWRPGRSTTRGRTTTWPASRASSPSLTCRAGARTAPPETRSTATRGCSGRPAPPQPGCRARPCSCPAPPSSRSRTWVIVSISAACASLMAVASRLSSASSAWGSTASDMTTAPRW